jgi:ACT domain-containing protein
MTQEEIILRHRINLLLRAKSIKNISAACRMFGVSRTVYYKYKQRYVTYGIEGLKDKDRAIPVMPNATKAKVVDKVLEVAKRYPTYGPARLAK